MPVLSSGTVHLTETGRPAGFFRLIKTGLTTEITHPTVIVWLNVRPNGTVHTTETVRLTETVRPTGTVLQTETVRPTGPSVRLRPSVLLGLAVRPEPSGRPSGTVHLL